MSSPSSTPAASDLATSPSSTSPLSSVTRYTFSSLLHIYRKTYPLRCPTSLNHLRQSRSCPLLLARAQRPELFTTDSSTPESDSQSHSTSSSSFDPFETDPYLASLCPWNGGTDTDTAADAVIDFEASSLNPPWLIKSVLGKAKEESETSTSGTAPTAAASSADGGESGGGRRGFFSQKMKRRGKGRGGRGSRGRSQHLYVVGMDDDREKDQERERERERERDRDRDRRGGIAVPVVLQSAWKRGGSAIAIPGAGADAGKSSEDETTKVLPAVGRGWGVGIGSDAGLAFSGAAESGPKKVGLAPAPAPPPSSSSSPTPPSAGVGVPLVYTSLTSSASLSSSNASSSSSPSPSATTSAASSPGAAAAGAGPGVPSYDESQPLEYYVDHGPKHSEAQRMIRSDSIAKIRDLIQLGMFEQESLRVRVKWSQGQRRRKKPKKSETVFVPWVEFFSGASKSPSASANSGSGAVSTSSASENGPVQGQTQTQERRRPKPTVRISIRDDDDEMDASGGRPKLDRDRNRDRDRDRDHDCVTDRALSEGLGHAVQKPKPNQVPREKVVPKLSLSAAKKRLQESERQAGSGSGSREPSNSSLVSGKSAHSRNGTRHEQQQHPVVVPNAWGKPPPAAVQSAWGAPPAAGRMPKNVLAPTATATAKVVSPPSFGSAPAEGLPDRLPFLSPVPGQAFDFPQGAEDQVFEEALEEEEDDEDSLLMSFPTITARNVVSKVGGGRHQGPHVSSSPPKAVVAQVSTSSERSRPAGVSDAPGPGSVEADRGTNVWGVPLATTTTSTSEAQPGQPGQRRKRKRRRRRKRKGKQQPQQQSGSSQSEQPRKGWGPTPEAPKVPLSRIQSEQRRTAPANKEVTPEPATRPAPGPKNVWGVTGGPSAVSLKKIQSEQGQGQVRQQVRPSQGRRRGGRQQRNPSGAPAPAGAWGRTPSSVMRSNPSDGGAPPAARATNVVAQADDPPAGARKKSEPLPFRLKQDASEDFKSWYRQKLRAIGHEDQENDYTLMYFLLSRQDDGEIQEYVTTVLGNNPAARDFAREFATYKAFEVEKRGRGGRKRRNRRRKKRQ